MQTLPTLDAADLQALPAADLDFKLPDPEDPQISEADFQQQLDTAWKVCDRFDLQTDIWRGRILRAVRDREKAQGNQRGAGFLNWLKDHEITKSQAYNLIELANSADTLLDEGHLSADDIHHFSKRAFVATAQAAPEVQQLVSDAASRGQRITRTQVRQLADEWTAMTSDVLPEEVRTKAANSEIPTRYLANTARELEKLPVQQREALQAEIAHSPEIDTLKQVASEARYLARYLEAAGQVQALTQAPNLDLERALEEAMRLGHLNLAADLVNQAAQLEQTLSRLYTTWKRVGSLTEKLYLESGASTPNLRNLIRTLEPLASQCLNLTLAETVVSLQIEERTPLAEEPLGEPPTDF
ncbi:hypothetical protein [Leptolyngbya sp. FACHB-261]|uniref:hypothetical protein n=1 Tax=Leptolyngbya sp. FACHB-261 TaxID=2692806 RepID=UPI00168A2023|nr:hypothetical protein [Leptolyngbya sp. FACHB-261]MBD2101239.1 hypothetical protein [Leptolyngbya sp. FACHB-261]